MGAEGGWAVGACGDGGDGWRSDGQAGAAAAAAAAAGAPSCSAGCAACTGTAGGAGACASSPPAIDAALACLTAGSAGAAAADGGGAPSTRSSRSAPSLGVPPATPSAPNRRLRLGVARTSALASPPCGTAGASPLSSLPRLRLCPCLDGDRAGLGCPCHRVRCCCDAADAACCMSWPVARIGGTGPAGGAASASAAFVLLLPLLRVRHRLPADLAAAGAGAAVGAGAGAGAAAAAGAAAGPALGALRCFDRRHLSIAADVSFGAESMPWGDSTCARSGSRDPSCSRSTCPRTTRTTAWRAGHTRER